MSSWSNLGDLAVCPRITRKANSNVHREETYSPSDLLAGGGRDVSATAPGIHVSCHGSFGKGGSERKDPEIRRYLQSTWLGAGTLGDETRRAHRISVHIEASGAMEGCDHGD